MVIFLLVSGFLAALMGEMFGGKWWAWMPVSAALIYYVLAMISKAEDEEAREKATATKSIFHWPSIGNFEFDVVGESYHQEALKRIAKARTNDLRKERFIATLVPESDNKHDKSAVRIDIEGTAVGHMNREDARSFRRRLAGKKMSGAVTSCDAMIGGGYEKSDGSTAMYGVSLDLKPFDS